jgi:hypothetical protein
MCTHTNTRNTCARLGNKVTLLVSLPDRVSNVARGAAVDPALGHRAYHAELALQVTRRARAAHMRAVSASAAGAASGALVSRRDTTDAHGDGSGTAEARATRASASNKNISVLDVEVLGTPVGDPRHGVMATAQGEGKGTADAVVAFASAVLEKLAVTGQHSIVGEALTRLATETKRAPHTNDDECDNTRHVDSCGGGDACGSGGRGRLVARLLSAFEGLPLELVVEAMVTRAAAVGVAAAESNAVTSVLSAAVRTNPAVRHAVCACAPLHLHTFLPPPPHTHTHARMRAAMFS